MMRDFTRGKIGKSIFLFSLPLVLGNVFQQLYTLVNSAFVGVYLGDKALAAVGSVYPIVFFLVSLVIGIGSGGSVVVSHFYGAKKNDGIPLVISTFYVSFIILGLVVCGLSILFAPYIFSLLNLNGDIMQDAVKYMRIYMIGMFFSFCFNSIASILRGLGDSRTQLLYLISANVLNILLSYVFLAVFHLDLVSTAWASVISQFAAFVALFVNVQKKNEYLRIRKRTEYFDKGIFREIVRIGLPTGVQQSVVALAQILILGIVVRFGTNALAAYSAASRIESIALLVVLNLSSALTSFVGHNFGAGQIQRVKQGLYGCIKIISAVSLVTFILFFFFAQNLISLFSSTEQILEIGSEYLKVSGLFWIIFSLMYLFTAFFRGTGLTLVPMVISVLTLLFIRIPLSYLLSFKYNTLGIWLGAPLSEIIGISIYIMYYKKSNWSGIKSGKSVALFVFAALTVAFGNLRAQNPCRDFISPLKIPLASSGHFAELRTNHFHSGIDLRTQSRIGLPVVCPYEGEVSRIKIQVWGGGKNLYIDHTNGYTTVYMHLDRYHGKIAEYVREYQYRNHCYSFDITVPKGKLRLKQGDTIAFSGNSGSSGGPHLHYEIRETRTQKTINPVLLGLKLGDDIAPKLYSLRLVPYDDYSVIEGRHEDKFIDLTSKNPFANGDTISAAGSLYLCIEAYDRSNGSTMKNGVYDTKVLLDDTVLFAYRNDSFSFGDSRYANAVVDYAYFKTNGRRMLQTKRLPNCRFPNVRYFNNGIIDMNSKTARKVEVILSDERGNRTDFIFYLKGELQNPNVALMNRLTMSKTEETEKTSSRFVRYVPYDKVSNFYTPDSSLISIRDGSLYENLELRYSCTEGVYSKVHRIHDNLTPLHKSFTMKLRYKPSLEPYRKKALVVSVDGKGRISSIGGKLEGRYIVANSSNFGTFRIEIDTVPPKARARNFVSGKRIRKNQSSIQIRISDNLSGVERYDAYLNGKWILMEYDGKSATISCDARQIPSGRNNLRLELEDARGNKTTANFVIVK